MAVALAAGLALVLEFRNSPGWISQTDRVDSLVLAPEWQWRLCLSGITAAAIALGMGYLTRWVGPRRGLVAIPRLWRVGTNPVPTLGGIGIVAGALAGVAASQWSEGKSAKVLGAAVGVTAMCVIGSVDDVGGLSSRTRLFVTIVVAELAWLLGLRAQVFDDGFLGDAANAVVTILWFIVVTHAFNTFDNFDGASGGVGAIAALSFAAIALQRDQIYVAGLAVAVAGACAGFLVHNRFPARLFMGDSGALAIGFALASIGLMLRPKASPPLTFAVPALVVGLPLFDAAVVISARLHASIPVAIGGTDHLAHRLSRSGLRPLAVAALLWCAQLGLAAAAFVVARASRGVGWTAGAAAAGVLVLSLWLVQRLPGWEPGSG